MLRLKLLEGAAMTGVAGIDNVAFPLDCERVFAGLESDSHQQYAGDGGDFCLQEYTSPLHTVRRHPQATLPFAMRHDPEQ
jgi:hypothetical protein